MTIEQMFVIRDIRDEVLKVIDSKDLLEDLNREIEKIVAPFDDGKIAISLKREIIELICSIEMTKIRFLRGEVRAKDLHGEVDFSLQQFHMQHQGFDYLNDPIFNAYFLLAQRRQAGSSSSKGTMGIRTGKVT